MQFPLAIVLTLLGISVMTVYAVVGRRHFRSARMPMAAMVLTIGLVVAMLICLRLMWTSAPPLLALVSGIGLESMALWIFLLAVSSSRDAGLRLAFDREPSDRLVVSGAYRYVRHPIYLSYLMFWAGACLGTGSPWSVPVLGIVAATYVAAARGEEAALTAGPGSEAYRAYRRSTGMLLPNIAAVWANRPSTSGDHE